MVSLERDAITRIELTAHADRTGTLTLNPPTQSQKRQRTARDTPKFERIADAQKVKDLLLRHPG